MYFITAGETIINTDHIVCIREHRDGKYYIELDNDTEIKVTDKNRLMNILRMALNAEELK